MIYVGKCMSLHVFAILGTNGPPIDDPCYLSAVRSTSTSTTSTFPPVRAFKTNTTRAQTPMLRLDISGPGMVMSLSETHGNWKQMLVLKPLNSPKKIWV